MLVHTTMFRNGWTIREYLCISTKFIFSVVTPWIYLKTPLKRSWPQRRLNILIITGNYALSDKPHYEHAKFFKAIFIACHHEYQVFLSLKSLRKRIRSGSRGEDSEMVQRIFLRSCFPRQIDFQNTVMALWSNCPFTYAFLNIVPAKIDISQQHLWKHAGYAVYMIFPFIYSLSFIPSLSLLALSYP